MGFRAACESRERTAEGAECSLGAPPGRSGQGHLGDTRRLRAAELDAPSFPLTLWGPANEQRAAAGGTEAQSPGVTCSRDTEALVPGEEVASCVSRQLEKSRGPGLPPNLTARRPNPGAGPGWGGVSGVKKPSGGDASNTPMTQMSRPGTPATGSISGAGRGTESHHLRKIPGNSVPSLGAEDRLGNR